MESCTAFAAISCDSDFRDFRMDITTKTKLCLLLKCIVLFYTYRRNAGIICVFCCCCYTYLEIPGFLKCLFFIMQADTKNSSIESFTRKSNLMLASSNILIGFFFQFRTPNFFSFALLVQSGFIGAGIPD